MAAETDLHRREKDQLISLRPIWRTVPTAGINPQHIHANSNWVGIALYPLASHLMRTGS